MKRMMRENQGVDKREVESGRYLKEISPVDIVVSAVKAKAI